MSLPLGARGQECGRNGEQLCDAWSFLFLFFTKVFSTNVFVTSQSVACSCPWTSVWPQWWTTGQLCDAWSDPVTTQQLTSQDTFLVHFHFLTVCIIA